MGSDFDALAKIFKKKLSADGLDEKIEYWQESPFKDILSLPSSTKGKLGEYLLEEFLKEKGCAVESSHTSSYDKIINGYKCEIKFSTLWKNNRYVFQQIRPGKWDYILCLGISPTEAHFWYAKKDINRHLAGQHRGQEGTDTKWIHITPNTDISEWYGGKLLGGKLATGIRMFLKEIKSNRAKP